MSYALGCVGVFMLLASVASSFTIFGASRALTGLAAGGVIPLGIALIGDRAPVSQRQMLLAKFMMATLTGQIAGGLVAGGLSPHIGWRAVMVIVAITAFAAGIISFIAVKPRSKADRTPFRFSTVMQNYAAILRHPRALPLFALVASEGGLIFGLFPYVAEILKNRDGSGSFEAGLVIGGFAIGGLAFSLLAKILFRHLTTRQMARLGGAMVALSFLLFAIPGLPWWSGIPIFTICGFGFYFLHNNFQAQATTLSETARASAVALFACFLFAGTALGPPFSGFLLHSGGEAVMLVTLANAGGRAWIRRADPFENAVKLARADNLRLSLCPEWGDTIHAQNTQPCHGARRTGCHGQRCQCAINPATHQGSRCGGLRHQPRRTRILHSGRKRRVGRL